MLLHEIKPHSRRVHFFRLPSLTERHRRDTAPIRIGLPFFLPPPLPLSSWRLAFFRTPCVKQPFKSKVVKKKKSKLARTSWEKKKIYRARDTDASH